MEVATIGVYEVSPLMRLGFTAEIAFRVTLVTNDDGSVIPSFFT
jgi:hypothetical protein